MATHTPQDHLAHPAQPARPVEPVLFRIDMYGGIALGAFAAAVVLSVLHGDFAALPPLGVLTAIALVALGVRARPEADAAAERTRAEISRTRAATPFQGVAPATRTESGGSDRSAWLTAKAHH